jgi:hypothetical protein
MSALALAFFLSAAQAATLAGVSLPDTATVGGQPVVLNGLGLREKYFMDIYVGGLYLPAKTKDASKAINDDVPKRIVMHFTYELSKDKLGGIMLESLNNSGSAAAKKHAAELAGWMTNVAPGDEITLDYAPGTGTSVAVGGQTKGTIAGPEFMKAIFGVYLGPKPPTKDLKAGMMSG